MQRDDPSGLVRHSGGRWRFTDALPGTPLGTWPLRMVEDPAKGRYLVAAQDLAAGQCICTEDPFVQTVHDDLQETVCHCCYGQLAVAAAASPCASCGMIRYCSCSVLRPLRACAVDAVLVAWQEIRCCARACVGCLFVRLVHQCYVDPDGLACVEKLAEHYTGAPPTAGASSTAWPRSQQARAPANADRAGGWPARCSRAQICTPSPTWPACSLARHSIHSTAHSSTRCAPSAAVSVGRAAAHTLHRAGGRGSDDCLHRALRRP